MEKALFQSRLEIIFYLRSLARVSFIEVHVILVYGGEMQKVCVCGEQTLPTDCALSERDGDGCRTVAGLLAVPGIGEREPQAGMHHTQLKSPRELVKTDFKGARFWLKRQD